MTSDVTFDELSTLAGELLPERTVLSGILPDDIVPVDVSLLVTRPPI